MKNLRRNHNHGFTLIEILVVVIMISILSAVAAASYRSYVVDARRKALTENLMYLQQQIEDFYLINHTYENACSVAHKGVDCSGSKDVKSHYTINYSISTVSGRDTYTLVANAIGSQKSSDHDCQYLFLRRNGERGGGVDASTASVNNCW